MAGPVVFVPLLAIVGIGIMLIAGALIWSVRKTRSRYEQPGSDLSPAREVHLRPLLRARADLAELVNRHANNPSVKVIGAEAIVEVDELIRHAEEVLRTDLPGHRADMQSQLAEARAEVQSLVSDLQATAVEREVDEASSALRESLSRIKSLSSSLEEAETLTDRTL